LQDKVTRKKTCNWCQNYDRKRKWARVCALKIAQNCTTKKAALNKKIVMPKDSICWTTNYERFEMCHSKQPY